MKRALVLMSLVALTSTAHADNRKAWKVTFATSVGVSIAGAVVMVHGRHQMDDARDALCDGGAYHDVDATCAQPVTGPTLTPSQVDDYNAQGDRGRMMARLGLATAGVASVVAVVALYKGFIQRESRVVITPDVGKDRAGAALQITW